jgi:hypothetical protein
MITIPTTASGWRQIEFEFPKREAITAPPFEVVGQSLDREYRRSNSS